MCGIAGWLGAMPDEETYAVRMAQLLHHRGPDAQGIRYLPGATLVHTRLSIIDLSPNGMQPMANEDGTIWTVFNGEIYNHQELRHRLEVRGHQFRGRSDTEVIPHLYEEYGPDFARDLRGMFSIALYDVNRRQLTLARDRFGIKPLFYASSPSRVTFASEINALISLPGIDDCPDRQAIYDFAALCSIPAPSTFYKGIRALQPGELLECHLTGDRVSWSNRTYHRWTIAPNFGLTLDQAADQAGALLETGVRSQIESDVPLGSLLSGGIDSSLVSAAAQKALQSPLHTYNVRFEENAYDETWAALAVSRHIHSQHETLDMNEVRGTWDHITDLLLHAGQPFADTSLFAVHGVCRLMRERLTVALSGDGGDEAFGGYSAYWRVARIARWQMLPTSVQRGLTRTVTALSTIGLLPGTLPDRLNDFADNDDTTIVQNLFQWTREAEHTRLCKGTDLLPVRRLFEPQWQLQLPRRTSRLERLSAHTTEVNSRLVLPNDFLFKVDTASMRESLEVRVPMLDEELFAFGLTLPHSLKAAGRTTKRVLRNVANRKLPQDVATKSKRGFGIPVDAWVEDDFKQRVREELLSSESQLPAFFHPEAYRPVIEAFCAGGTQPGISRQELYQRAIMLLAVHLFTQPKHRMPFVAVRRG